MPGDPVPLGVGERELLGVVSQDADRVGSRVDEEVGDPPLARQAEVLVVIECGRRHREHAADHDCAPGRPVGAFMISRLPSGVTRLPVGRLCIRPVRHLLILYGWGYIGLAQPIADEVARRPTGVLASLTP